MGAPMRREWPTWLALALDYAVWALATVYLTQFSVLLAIIVAGLAAALHSSLNHEALHGHPTRNSYVNAALVFPALSLFIPYFRFRDTHLTHHRDERLTDPYDDPESNFQDPDVWARLGPAQRRILRLNNTLAGRMVLGPILSQISFMSADAQAIRAGDRRVLQGWLLHIPAVAVVIWWANAVGQMPGWAYVAAAYLGLAILKIRTYLEHRANLGWQGRTVLVEDRGPLAFLFLNNNYHIVHHTHPGLPWVEIPQEFRSHRDQYLALNGGYYYRSYRDVFRRYLWHAKDPVPHPLWSKPG